MGLNIVKLAVGAETVEDMASWIASGRADFDGPGGEDASAHITRMTPKRADELLAGGSLYWVIRGQICLRQRLIALTPVTRDGRPHCAFVLDKTLVLTRPRPQRAFQGWRYLEGAKVPKDIGAYSAGGEGSDTLRRELMELGLV